MLSTVRFPDPLIVAVGSKPVPYSRGPSRPFRGQALEGPLSLPMSLMCGPASPGSRLSGTAGTCSYRAGQTAKVLRWFARIFPCPQGAISSFHLSFWLDDCGEDGRGDLLFVAGYGARWAWLKSSRGMERGAGSDLATTPVPSSLSSSSSLS
jgi:hypothetical protein